MCTSKYINQHKKCVGASGSTTWLKKACNINWFCFIDFNSLKSIAFKWLMTPVTSVIRTTSFYICNISSFTLTALQRCAKVVIPLKHFYILWHYRINLSVFRQDVVTDLHNIHNYLWVRFFMNNNLKSMVSICIQPQYLLINKNIKLANRVHLSMI